MLESLKALAGPLSRRSFLGFPHSSFRTASRATPSRALTESTACNHTEFHGLVLCSFRCGDYRDPGRDRVTGLQVLLPRPLWGPASGLVSLTSSDHLSSVFQRRRIAAKKTLSSPLPCLLTAALLNDTTCKIEMIFTKKLTGEKLRSR